MLRYKLRTLMIVLAIGPPVVAVFLRHGKPFTTGTWCALAILLCFNCVALWVLSKKLSKA